METGYPIKIMYKGKVFFSLYFDEGDTLLGIDGKIICYSTMEELCNNLKNHFIIDKSLCIYDFDNLNLNNPIDYNDILVKWNLLNTIAKMFNMYFEGNAKERTYTYNYLFSCNFAIEKLPKTIEMPNRCIKDINKTFKKKDRYLKRLFL